MGGSFITDTPQKGVATAKTRLLLLRQPALRSGSVCSTDFFCCCQQPTVTWHSLPDTEGEREGRKEGKTEGEGGRRKGARKEGRKEKEEEVRKGGSWDESREEKEK